MPAERIVRRAPKWALFGVGVLACSRILGQAAGDKDAAVVPLLRERLQQMQAKGAGGPSSMVAARAAMPKIYEPGGNRPLWNPERLDTLLALIRASAEDGLRPEDYHLGGADPTRPAVASGARSRGARRRRSARDGRVLPAALPPLPRARSIPSRSTRTGTSSRARSAEAAGRPISFATP